MPIIIRKGEWLTHEGGERYVRATRDIYGHEQVRSADFEFEDGSSPTRGEPIPEDVVKSKDGIVSWANINGRWYDLKQPREAQDEAYGIL